MNLTYAVRALTVSSTVFTWAMGWGAVWVLKKRRARPLERFTPAPAWVNGLFMLGLTMILGSILAGNIIHITTAITWINGTLLSGQIVLAIGTAALLRSFSR